MFRIAIEIYLEYLRINPTFVYIHVCICIYVYIHTYIIYIYLYLHICVCMYVSQVGFFFFAFDVFLLRAYFFLLVFIYIAFLLSAPVFWASFRSRMCATRSLCCISSNLVLAVCMVTSCKRLLCYKWFEIHPASFSS